MRGLFYSLQLTNLVQNLSPLDRCFGRTRRHRPLYTYRSLGTLGLDMQHRLRIHRRKLTGDQLRTGIALRDVSGLDGSSSQEYGFGAVSRPRILAHAPHGHSPARRR